MRNALNLISGKRKYLFGFVEIRLGKKTRNLEIATGTEFSENL